MNNTKNESKHTPGPWEADIHMGNNGYEIADMIEPSICEMVSSHSPEETKANARLIASAPELLEALKSLLVAIDSGGHGVRLERSNPMCVSFARNAIARAEGRGE